ncbi:MAG TPA: serine/threonine-protein kinase [Mycobacteriales bacterium]|nr:serine/threonine-protein kinase [Mycobacteriales bacterium]
MRTPIEALPAGDLAGRVLAGRYRLTELIGQGGCASVYAARDERLDQEVAVKAWADPDAVTEEGRLTAGLRHPGVITVHGAVTDGELAFLVMERVHGRSLAQELRDGPLAPDRAVRLCAQLARTLACVHGDGVVHGDVKPANVLVGLGDVVTLTDFGTASPDGARHRDLAHGTVPYLSPEQVRGDALTAATDVYAAGLLLLECLTGRRAFPGPVEAAARARLEAGPLVPTYVARDLAALVRRMTALDPTERPSAEQVAEELDTRHARPTAVMALTAAGPPTRGQGTAQTTLLHIVCKSVGVVVEWDACSHPPLDCPCGTA